MNSEPKTKKCPSCNSDVSFGATKCPYCGKDFRNWFRQHPVLTTVLGFFIFSEVLGGLSSVFYDRKASSPKNSVVKTASPRGNAQVAQAFDAQMLAGQTIFELEQILGEPSSRINPSGKMYGEVQWEKNGINLYINYLDRNIPPQALDFQFTSIEFSFSSDDFNKAFRLIGLELVRNQFKDVSPPGFTKYAARNLMGFEQVEAQAMLDDKTHIKSIFLIQSCEPEPLCK